MYLSAYSYYDSEPIPALQIGGNWESNYRSGNTSFSYEWYELGFKKNKWGGAILSRRQTYVKFSSETVDVFRLIENKKVITDQSYQLDIDVKSFEALGGRLFFQLFSKPRFRWQAAMSFFQTKRLLDGMLKGRITALSESDYEYDNVELNYYYSKDQVFDHQVDKPVGRGYALDTQIFWKPSSRQKIWIDFRDILGQIVWHKAPITKANIISDNKSFDENGYVKIKPLLSGNQSTKKFVQYLPVYFYMKTEIMLIEKHSMLLELEHFHVKSYIRVGYKHHITKSLYGEMLYDQLNKVVGFGLANNTFQFKMLSDNVDFYKAYLLVVKFNIAMTF